MSKVYILRGSEDGNVGVYGSAFRAAKEAYQYVERGGWTPCETVQAMTAKLRGGKRFVCLQPTASQLADAAADGGCFCEIQAFEVE